MDETVKLFLQKVGNSEKGYILTWLGGTQLYIQNFAQRIMNIIPGTLDRIFKVARISRWFGSEVGNRTWYEALPTSAEWEMKGESENVRGSTSNR